MPFEFVDGYKGQVTREDIDFTMSKQLGLTGLAGLNGFSCRLMNNPATVQSQFRRERANWQSTHFRMLNNTPNRYKIR
jgi:hypothetical protein